MAKRFSADITLGKVNNSRQLSLELVANQPLSQVHNALSESVTPDWTTSPYLVITPVLAVDGNTANAISEIDGAPVWSIDGKSTAAELASYGATASPAYPYALTIKKNLVVDLMRVQFEASHKDPSSEVLTPIQAELTFNRSTSGGVLLSTTMLYPDGAVFTDTTDQLTAECEIKQGEVVVTEFSGYTIVWSRKVGNTWQTIDTDDSGGISGYTTNIVTIPINACPTRLELKCEVADDASGQMVVSECLLFNRENSFSTSILEGRIDLPDVGVNLMNGTNDGHLWIGAEFIGDNTITAAVEAKQTDVLSPYINVQVGHIYTISFTSAVSTPSQLLTIMMRSDVGFEYIDNNFVLDDGPYKKSFVVPEGYERLRFVLACRYSDTAYSRTFKDIMINAGNSEIPYAPSIANGGTQPSASTLYSLTSVVNAGKLDTGVKMSDVLGYSLRYRLKTADANVGIYGGTGLHRSATSIDSGQTQIDAPIGINDWCVDSLSNNALYIGGDLVGEYVPDLSVRNVLADGNEFIVGSTASSQLSITRVAVFDTKKAIKVVSAGGTTTTKALKVLVPRSQASVAGTVSYAVDVWNNHPTDILTVSSSYSTMELQPNQTKRVVFENITLANNNDLILAFRAASVDGYIDVVYANVLLVYASTVGDYEDSLSTFKLYGAENLSDATDLEISQCDIQTIDGTVHKFLPVQVGEAKGWLDAATNEIKYNDGTAWLTAGAKVSDDVYLRVEMMQNGAVVPPFKMSKMNFNWSAVDENGALMTFVAAPSVKSQIVGLNRTNQLRPYVRVTAQYE